MKSLLLFIAFSLTSLFANSQTPAWQWGKEPAGLTKDAGATNMAVDVNGNLYVTGIFTSPQIVFGKDTLLNTGYENVFVVKYDASGNVVWARSGSGSGDMVAFSNGITLDAFGNFFITGYFNSASITFGNTTLINVNSSGVHSDIFVAKYDTAGNFTWAKQAGGSDDDYGFAIATDEKDNSYLTGNFQSPSITFGSTTLTNTNTNSEIFIVKYDPAGNAVWAKSASGFFDDKALGIAVDKKGNSFLTGDFDSNTLTFGNITLTGNNNGSAFIAKLDTSGNALWAKNASGYYNSNSIALDAAGNSYITGEFSGTSVTFGNTTLINSNSSGSTSDLFVAKYDSLGNILWAKGAGGTSYEWGNRITADATGNTYTTGKFMSAFIAFGNDTITNSGSVNIYAVKYDASGNLLWAIGAGGAKDDEGAAIGIDAVGNAYVTGTITSDTIVFGNDLLTDSSILNAFTAKIITSIATPIANENAPSGNSNIYPNPSNGLLTITMNGLQAHQLIITNVLGQQVYSTGITSHKTQIDLSARAKGIYFYRLQGNDNKAQTGKIIID